MNKELKNMNTSVVPNYKVAFQVKPRLVLLDTCLFMKMYGHYLVVCQCWSDNCILLSSNLQLSSSLVLRILLLTSRLS